MPSTPTFQVRLTGDLLNSQGEPALAGLGIDRLANIPNVEHEFLLDQAPAADNSEQRSQYELAIEPWHIDGVNALVVVRPWVKESTFAEGAAELVGIARAGIGYDKLDLEACTHSDVVVYNVPDTLVHSTACSAFTFMIALSMRLTEQERLARSGRWDQQSQVVGNELTGKTLGIVGLGHTARELCRLAAPFNMRIIAFSPHADPQQAEQLSVELVNDLETVFRDGDFVSLHNRLLEHNHGMVTADHFALMKTSAYFINVARGELIDQAALTEALAERRIAGAGLDVFATEPLPVDDPMVSLENVILTPHWLPSTREACRNTMGAVIAGIDRLASGQVPDNVLNRAVLERAGFREKLSRWQ